MGIDIIFCAGGGKRFAEIAMQAGFLYGVQVPQTAYYPVHFCDQDWKKPDKERYMEGLKQHRPAVATVLDWEREEQLPEVLAWAEDAAQHVSTVVIIPKVQSGISQLPRSIGGATIRLGYSVPTRFGGTEVPVWEFAGWPVHLLGGTPHKQMDLARYLDVMSVDGSIAKKLAIRYGQFWVPGTAVGCRNHYWPKLSEVGDHRTGDMPYEAFRRSCINAMNAWQAVERRNA